MQGYVFTSSLDLKNKKEKETKQIPEHFVPLSKGYKHKSYLRTMNGPYFLSSESWASGILKSLFILERKEIVEVLCSGDQDT